MTSRLLAPLLALGLGAAPPEELAEGLLRSGDRAYATRAHGEAMETWAQVLRQAPQSRQAGEALLRMARHLALVEARVEPALAHLERLRTEFLKTPAAAEGLVLRAELLTLHGRRPQDLKDAEADLRRALDLFPADPGRLRAHLALARVLELAGDEGRALEQVLEVLRGNPRGAEAPAALLLGAGLLDRSGDLNASMRFLQRLRETFPDLPEALEARRRMGLVARHRLLRMPPAAQGLWPEGRKDWLKTPTLLGLGPAGQVYVYQDDLDQAFRLEGGTLVPVGPPVKGVRALAFTPDGRLVQLSPKVGLVVEGQANPLPLGGLGHPSGVVADRWGGFWLSDARAGSLTHLSAEGAARPLPSPAMVALVALPDGGMVGASDANRTLILLDRTGQPRLSIPYGKGLPAAFRSVLSLAADACGHIAALVEGDYEGVVIWGPQGEVLRHATFKELGIGGRFRAITLDGEGNLFLADRSGDQIHRLR